VAKVEEQSEVERVEYEKKRKRGEVAPRGDDRIFAGLDWLLAEVAKQGGTLEVTHHNLHTLRQ
jgi:hypothetical protein